MAQKIYRILNGPVCFGKSIEVSILRAKHHATGFSLFDCFHQIPLRCEADIALAHVESGNAQLGLLLIRRSTRELSEAAQTRLHHFVQLLKGQ